MIKPSPLILVSVAVLVLLVISSAVSIDLFPKTLEAQGPPSSAPAQGGPSGWTDEGTVVRLTTDTDSVGIGTVSPIGKLEVVGDISLSGLIDGIDLSLKALNWDIAFSERRQWDGSITNLNDATGRTSLRLDSLKVKDTNSLNSAIFKDTDGPNCHKLTINSSGLLNTVLVDCVTGGPPPPPLFTLLEGFDTYSLGDLDPQSDLWVTDNNFDVSSGCNIPNEPKFNPPNCLYVQEVAGGDSTTTATLTFPFLLNNGIFRWTFTTEASFDEKHITIFTFRSDETDVLKVIHYNKEGGADDATTLEVNGDLVGSPGTSQNQGNRVEISFDFINDTALVSLIQGIEILSKEVNFLNTADTVSNLYIEHGQNELGINLGAAKFRVDTFEFLSN